MTIFNRGITGRILKFLPPDYIDQQAGQYILIWREIPFTTLLDGMVFRLFWEMDGRYTLGELLQRREEWRALKKKIIKIARCLLARGVVVDMGLHR